MFPECDIYRPACPGNFSDIYLDVSSETSGEIQVANPVFEDLQMDIVMKQPTYFPAGSEAVN